MERFLSKLTLKQKIRFGFGVIWAALAIITIQAAVNLYIVRLGVQEMVHIKQPIVSEASQTASILEKSMISLTSYILTNDQQTLTHYQNRFKKAKISLATLKSKVAANMSSEQQKNINNIAHSLNQLEPLVVELQKLQANRSKKFPAFEHVNNQMLAPSREIQQQINIMINSEISELSPERKPVLDALLKMQKDWLNVISSVRGYVAFRTESMATDTEAYLNEIEKVIEGLNSQDMLELTFEEESGLEIVQSAYEIYRENFMMLKQIHQGPQWRMDVWLMKTKVKPLFIEIEGGLSSLSEYAQDQMKSKSDELLETTLRNLILLLSLSVLGQLVGMIISRKVTHSVVAPAINSATAMKDIAQGEGDLTRRLDVKGKDELADLAKYFNEFISKIQATLQEVTATVKELEVASQGLLDVTHTTKNGVNNQLTASEQLSQTMLLMAEKAKNVEDHSHNTSRATGQALDRVKEGGTVVQDAAKTIQLVSNGMQEITHAVTQLNDDSQTIGSVINVIREIAEQTNLLALNAAIEAARAGEHGRGFAVVADEVRQLAKRTQESTLEIERVIEKICQATDSTVGVVEQGQKTTQSGYDSVMKAQKVLSPVMILMDDINGMSEQMLASAQSQNELVQQVNTNIRQIHDVSEQTVEGAGDTESSGKRLQQLADKLDRLVHQFKI